jgi:transcriptional regulator with XRE-family HTH domain
MAELPEALDRALRARYMPGEIRSPVDTRRGLTARLNALERSFTQQGDRKGAATKRVAAALGVTPRTLQRWRDGSRKPNAASLRKISGAHNRLVTLPKMRKRLKNLPPPNSVTVSAKIDWNGYKNRTEQRTTTLGGMRGVMARVIRTWAAAGPEAAADALQRGAATVHNVPNSEDAPGIQFEGDDVDVDFPWE